MKQSSMTPPILIVDDEPNVLKELPKAFFKSFPESLVHTANSFPEALELLKVYDYGIVMLDGELSGKITNPPEHGFGYNLIPFIKSHCLSAIIIMISSDKDMCGIGMKMGAHYSFSKNLFFKNGKVVNSLRKNEDRIFSIEEGV